MANPAFVVRDWGDGPATVGLDGAIPKLGVRHTREGPDLIAWVRHEGARPITITIEHGDRHGRRSPDEAGA